MEPTTVEDICAGLRSDIQRLKELVADTKYHDDFSADQNLVANDIEPSRNKSAKANLTLVFRHLEDARMRCGKVMQAMQGGVSHTMNEVNG